MKALNSELRLEDLSTNDNRIYLKMKNTIIERVDNESLLIFRKFRLGLVIPFYNHVENNLFYREFSDILMGYAHKINNYSITRLSNIQFVDLCNRVAFEFVASGNFIYQEGMIIPEVK